MRKLSARVYRGKGDALISKFNRLLYLFLFLSAFIPSQIVAADIGPKPTMEFSFTQMDGLTITSGILYQCNQSDCSDAEPLRELGPQRLRCKPDSCSALAYGFAPYNRLEIVFSDGKTRASNVFEPAGFDSLYKVTVRQSDLLVEAQFNPASLSPVIIFLLVCSCILIFGILAAIFFFFVMKRLQKK